MTRSYVFHQSVARHVRYALHTKHSTMTGFFFNVLFLSPHPPTHHYAFLSQQTPHARSPPSESVFHRGSDINARDAAVLKVRFRSKVHEVYPETIHSESGGLQVFRLFWIGSNQSHLAYLRCIFLLHQPTTTQSAGGGEGGCSAESGVKREL